jgi:hypothetical protein
MCARDADYHFIINKPMDLSTISRKHQAGAYTCAQVCCRLRIHTHIRTHMWLLICKHACTNVVACSVNSIMFCFMAFTQMCTPVVKHAWACHKVMWHVARMLQHDFEPQCVFCLQEFIDDVRLTFENAMAYNPPGHQVHRLAQTLGETFENMWTEVRATLRKDQLE